MNVREMLFEDIHRRVRGGEDIVLVTSDLAAPSLDSFRREFPERYLSVGVAEQNLIATASGLAIGGKKVVAWGLNPFVATRAYDQIRNTASLMNLPIVFAGLHAGLSSAISGPTHVVLTDISLMRTCPNITTYNVSDLGLAERIYQEALKFERPCYLRIDKDVSYSLEREVAEFTLGFSRVNSGEDVCVVTTGYHVKVLRDLLPDLAGRGMCPELVDVYRYPCDGEQLAQLLRRFRRIVTVEEHMLQGGLGSYVLEIMAAHDVLLPVHRLGIDAERGYPELDGGRRYFEKLFGLDREGLEKMINDAYGKLSQGK